MSQEYVKFKIDRILQTQGIELTQTTKDQSLQTRMISAEIVETKMCLTFRC